MLFYGLPHFTPIESRECRRAEVFRQGFLCCDCKVASLLIFMFFNKGLYLIRMI